MYTKSMAYATSCNFGGNILTTWAKIDITYYCLFACGIHFISSALLSALIFLDRINR